MNMGKKVYVFTQKDSNDGKIYDYYCEKHPCGAYKWYTSERREVTDKKYIEWYNKTH